MTTSRTLTFGLEMPCPTKRIRAPWENRQIPDLVKGQYKASLKHLLAPKTKDVLKALSGAVKRTQDLV